MKAVQSGVKDVLEGSKQYVLPLYQRRYSWSFKHWAVLTRDIARLLAEPDRRSHFIGSFVTAPLDHAADQNVNRYRLIDGQQRLTTLLLALAALRDVANAKGERELAAEISGLYLSNSFKKGDAARKLIPTGDDRTEFFAALDGAPLPGKIGEAHRFFVERFSTLRPADLGDARQAIVGRLSVVSITLENDDDPHLIFESLNAKGERLTQADLLRNYFLMRLPQADADEHFARLWQPMQQSLGDDLTPFFRHFLMRDPEAAEVRSEEVYAEVKDRVDDRSPSAASVVETLEEVRRYAGYYARLVAPATHEPDAAMVARLQRLHRLKVTTAYPFLLNLMDAVDAGRLRSTTLIATLDVIEAFLVRRLVCGVPTNQLRQIFRALCQFTPIDDDATFITAIRNALSQKQRCPNDVAFGDAIAWRPMYAGSKNDVARFILERIEVSFEHKEQADVLAAGVQLEHIMPQTMTDAWRAELSTRPSPAVLREQMTLDVNAVTATPDEVHARWLHTLGNLTLTGYNAELGNQPFASKRARYAESHFALNASLAECERWDAAAIEARGVALAMVAIQLWADPGAGILVKPDVATARAKRTPIVAVILDGERVAVTSTLDAADHVFTKMFAADPARYRQALVKVLPSRRRTGGPDGFRGPRRIGDQHLDLHGSSRWLQRISHELVAKMGLPATTLRFELEPADDVARRVTSHGASRRAASRLAG